MNQLGLPVVCVESRQAYQALKSLATHKTDRNDARGLAHLARTGFFKPVHVKSLQAHALRSLIIARKKLVGQRVTLENQIRGLAVVFGVRLPRALHKSFIDNALKASEGIAGLSVAMRGLSTARTAVMTAVAAIDADMARASAEHMRSLLLAIDYKCSMRSRHWPARSLLRDVPASQSGPTPPKGPAVSAERRPITVMFCDLVGSTSMAAKLDAEDWRTLGARRRSGI